MIMPSRLLPGRLRSPAAKAGLVATGTSLFAAATAFVVNVLMARQLGPSARGYVTWFLQLSYILTPLITLGSDRRALKSNYLWSNNPQHIWLISLTFAGAAYGWGSPALSLSALAAGAGAIVAMERSRAMSSGDHRRFIAIHLGIQIWTLAASAALFVLGPRDQVAWLAIYAAPAAPLFLTWLAKRLRRQPEQRPELRQLSYMLGGLSLMLAGRVERLILPAVSSNRQLGLYVSMATASEFVAWAARGVSESRVSRLKHAGPTEFARQLLSDLAVLCAASLPIAAGMKFLLLPALGEGFAPAEELILPLCLASIMWALYLQCSALWLGRRSSSASSLFDLTTFLLVAGLTATLGSKFGALGAAYACIASYSLMIILSIFTSRRPEDSR